MQHDFSRYKCQLALPEFNEAKQQQLQNGKVLVVGAGGLGCPATQYLAAAGVGTIGIADFDTISVSNLHRQILYSAEEVGSKKTVTACKKLTQLNPGVSIIEHDIKISSGNVLDVIRNYDIIIDCTDNFETKYLLNDACALERKPLIYGAIYQYEGQVAVWNFLNDDNTRTPNYRDLFPDVNTLQIPNCADGGVMPTLSGIIGCMQANEAIKYFTKTGELLAGKILMLDVLTMQSRIIKLGSVTKTNITKLAKSVGHPTITADELKKIIDKDEYELIDVRTAEERDVFNIGGKHIPLHDLEKTMQLFNTEKSLVLYCATGQRSADAVRMIKNKFPGRQIFSLEGGLKVWNEFNHDIPIVRSY